MQMMGYNTNFIHVNCVNLLASNNFTEKRTAYLSICSIMDEQSEVLLLTANQIKKDLDNNNTLVIAMALNAIGEICTADMCRELSGEVGKLMRSIDPYIKRKAAIAAIKIIRKCPEFIESFIKPLNSYFEDKNNGVILAGLSLMAQMYKIEPSSITNFLKHSSFIIKYLKLLLQISYSPEYDVNGVTDPFLQVKILEVLSYMGKENQEKSDEMGDILALVATSTDSNRNVGNAILYELVKTINNVESSSALKSVGSNILGKFLSSRDNNYKYIALNTLKVVARIDISSVQKHKNTILECLKEHNDISIKRRALDLVFLIVNSNNVKQIIKECLNFLLKAENEFKLELTSKIVESLDKYSNNIKYEIDTLVKMLCISGNYVSEDSVSKIINLIIAYPELHSYSVHKLFIACKNYLDQEGLVKVTIYTIGELGQLLTTTSVHTETESINYNENDIVTFIKTVNTRKYSTTSVQEYIMNCLVKLSTRFMHSEIKDIINSERKSFNFEVQQRAVEYSVFQGLNENLKQEITSNIPLSKNTILEKK
jgi:AP-1 complex subunit gamma-1